MLFFSKPCLQFIPRMSAVSFLRTKICTFILASPSARRGKIQEQSLSTFLRILGYRNIINVQILNAHQTSTFLCKHLFCWKMFGLSQLLDKTITSSLSMPKLALILSRLSVFSVAELSMNGTPW